MKTKSFITFIIGVIAAIVSFYSGVLLDPSNVFTVNIGYAYVVGGEIISVPIISLINPWLILCLVMAFLFVLINYRKSIKP